MVHENYRATALDRVAASFKKVSKCFEIFINISDIGTICILELCIQLKACGTSEARATAAAALSGESACLWGAPDNFQTSFRQFQKSFRNVSEQFQTFHKSFRKLQNSFRQVSESFGNDSRCFRATSENLQKTSQTFTEQSQASVSHAACIAHRLQPRNTGTICAIELNNNLKASAAAGRGVKPAIVQSYKFRSQGSDLSSSAHMRSL